MRPYGLPRTLDLEFPDCVDCGCYGLKSSYGKKKKDGSFYLHFKSSEGKRNARRVWKKLHRVQTKRQTFNELKEALNAQD